MNSEEHRKFREAGERFKEVLKKVRKLNKEEFREYVAQVREKTRKLIEDRNLPTCLLKGQKVSSQKSDKWLRFEGKDHGDEHWFESDQKSWEDDNWEDFEQMQLVVGQTYYFWIYGEHGEEYWGDWGEGFDNYGTMSMIIDDREIEMIEIVGISMNGLNIKLKEGYGTWKTNNLDSLPGTMIATPSGVCPDGDGGGTGPPPPPPPNPEPEPEPEPLPPPTVDPIPPGANDGRGNCGLDDGCKPTGTVWGGGDFKDWMELVGSDGHKVTYTRQNLMEETPIGDSIPGLHPGIVYEYTLFSDCGVSNDGLVNGACQIDHKISMEGRKMEMEDMMGEPDSINYTDLVLTLDEGVGLFAKTGPTTGTLTMADICASEEGEAEDEDPNMTCTTGTILSTGYTDPTFYTHAFDPAMVRSVDVINPYDPDARFLRIVFDPHVCDMDEIIASLCMCTSETADGDPIVEFKEVTATKVDDYTIDVVFRAMIIETHGYEP